MGADGVQFPGKEAIDAPEGPATHQGQGAAQGPGQAAQPPRQFRWHHHPVRMGRQFQQGPVDVKEERPARGAREARHRVRGGDPARHRRPSRRRSRGQGRVTASIWAWMRARLRRRAAVSSMRAAQK